MNRHPQTEPGQLPQYESVIADVHWEACTTCRHQDRCGDVDALPPHTRIYLGDWLVCLDYEADPNITEEWV